MAEKTEMGGRKKEKKRDKIRLRYISKDLSRKRRQPKPN